MQRTLIAVALMALCLASLSVGGPSQALSPSASNNGTNNGTKPADGNSSKPGCDVGDMPDIPGVDCDQMKWAHYAVASLTILIGLVWAFFGYRILKIVLFLAGFVLLSYVTYQTLFAFKEVPQAMGQYSDYIILGIAAVMGILGGLLILKLFRIGVFCLGFIFGAVVAVVVVSFTPLISVISNSTSVDPKFTMWITLACIVGLGILCGILAVIFIRPVVIFVTAWNGAFMAMYAVDKMAKTDLLHILKGVFNWKMPVKPIDPKDWPPYVIFGGLVLIAVLGIIVQSKITARGVRRNAHGNESDTRKPLGEDEIPLIQDV